MEPERVARLLLTPLALSFSSADMVHSQAERVFILEHYFASRSFGTKNLTVPILRRKHRIRRQFTDW